VEFVEQTEQLGTGHAVQQYSPLRGLQGDLLVLGDVPLLRPLKQQLLRTHQEHQNAATILTAQLPNPQGTGGYFVTGKTLNKSWKIGTTPKTKSPHQCWGLLLPLAGFGFCAATTSGRQRPILPADAVNQLKSVMAVDVEDYQEILGINDRQQLATAYEILQRRVKSEWMTAGVTLID